MSSIGVLGAGTWGMALAVMLTKEGHDVTVWMSGRDIECSVLAGNEVHKIAGRSLYSQGYPAVRRSFGICTQHSCPRSPVHQRRTADRRRSQGHRSQFAVYHDTGHRGRNDQGRQTGPPGGAHRTDARRGSRTGPAHSDRVCQPGYRRGTDRTGCLYESRIPGLYQP